MLAVGYTILSADVFSKTISLTTSSIFQLGRTLLYGPENSYVDLSTVEKVERQLDLLETIKIYDIWIQEVIQKEKETIEQSLAFKESIRSFLSILQQIHELLQQIDKKVESHKLKWFHSYRGISFYDEIETMNCLKNILDHRFTMVQQMKR